MRPLYAILVSLLAAALAVVAAAIVINFPTSRYTWYALLFCGLFLLVLLRLIRNWHLRFAATLFSAGVASGSLPSVRVALELTDLGYAEFLFENSDTVAVCCFLTGGFLVWIDYLNKKPPATTEVVVALPAVPSIERNANGVRFESYPGRPLDRALTDRDDLRAWLSDWRSSTDAVGVLWGEGGTGKTSSALSWVRKDLINASSSENTDDPIRRVIYWDFERDAQLEALFDVIFSNDERRLNAPDKGGDTLTRVNRACSVLNEDRTLLILDSCELHMPAFSPDSSQEGSEADDARAFVPSVRAFAETAISACQSSKVLILSRLCPKGFEQFDGVGELKIKNPSPDQAIAMLRNAGLEGLDDEILGRLAAHLNYMPQLLFTVARSGKSHPLPRAFVGKVIATPQHGDTTVANRAFEQVFDALPNSSRRLLTTLAAMSSGIDVEMVKEIIRTSFKEWVWQATLGKRQEFAIWHWSSSLQRDLATLKERGLISIEDQNEQIEMHPVVRGEAYSRLADKRDIHRRLANFHRERSAKIVPSGLVEGYFPGEKKIVDRNFAIGMSVTRLEELSHVRAWLHHLARAGQHRRAFRLYWMFLRPCVRDQFANQSVWLACLRELVVDESGPSKSLPAKKRVDVIIDLLQCYLRMGMEEELKTCREWAGRLTRWPLLGLRMREQMLELHIVLAAWHAQRPRLAAASTHLRRAQVYCWTARSFFRNLWELRLPVPQRKYMAEYHSPVEALEVLKEEALLLGVQDRSSEVDELDNVYKHFMSALEDGPAKSWLESRCELARARTYIYLDREAEAQNAIRSSRLCYERARIPAGTVRMAPLFGDRGPDFKMAPEARGQRLGDEITVYALWLDLKSTVPTTELVAELEAIVARARANDDLQFELEASVVLAQGLMKAGVSHDDVELLQRAQSLTDRCTRLCNDAHFTLICADLQAAQIAEIPAMVIKEEPELRQRIEEVIAVCQETGLKAAERKINAALEAATAEN